MSKTLSKITISVDDGHPLDLKLAEIFANKGIRAVFYVPIKRPGEQVMTKNQIRQIAQKFEIGAHTYSHADLTKLTLSDAYIQMSEGKKALEDILGKKINSFAFPFGHYNNAVVEAGKTIGFTGCRSGRIINFHNYEDEVFLKHPNLHIYPHRLSTDLLHCLKYGDLRSFWGRLRLADREHLKLIELLPDGPLHLWCHSQDIEEFNLWNIFDNLV